EITSAASIKLASASPGLFAFPGREPRTGILLHSRNIGLQDGTPVTSDTPARPGEIVTVWATGLRVPSDQDLVAGVPNHASALPLNGVAGYMNGEPAQVISANLPRNAVGIYEVRIALPESVSTLRTAQLVISQDGNTSNTVTFPFQPVAR
ncbi:MAG: hypothetical protein JOZ62_04935, partial [Acidobacteriaceae bacterium]|nr:hypothetical protein [Acidobacteriaceae bacterium]